MMFALDRERDVRIFSKRRIDRVQPRFPARVIATALFTPRDELGIEAEREIVDEEAFVDARGVDLKDLAIQCDIERVAQLWRDAEFAGEVVVNADWDVAKD